VNDIGYGARESTCYMEYGSGADGPPEGPCESGTHFFAFYSAKLNK